MSTLAKKAATEAITAYCRAAESYLLASEEFNRAMRAFHFDAVREMEGLLHGEAVDLVSSARSAIRLHEASQNERDALPRVQAAKIEALRAIIAEKTPDVEE